MANLRNTKLFKERLAQLEEEASERGVVFVPGQAADLLAERLTFTANQLGVTERTALQTYIAPHTISLLAKVLAEHAATYRTAADQAEPVTITVPNAGRLLAAIGVVCKLATERIRTDPTDAAGMLTDAADAVAGLGAQLAARTSADEPVTVSGPTLVFSRSVLTRVIDRLTAGSWTCPCRETHLVGKPCTLVRGLTGDLNNIGGWLTVPQERRGDDR